MTEKIKIIGPGKVDSTYWKKQGKSFLITIAGAALGFVLNFLGIIDYGSYTTIAATALPFITNAARKWLGSYESK